MLLAKVNEVVVKKKQAKLQVVAESLAPGHCASKDNISGRLREEQTRANRCPNSQSPGHPVILREVRLELRKFDL